METDLTHLAAAIDATDEVEARNIGMALATMSQMTLNERPELWKYADVLRQVACALLDHADSHAGILRDLAADLEKGGEPFDDDPFP